MEEFKSNSIMDGGEWDETPEMMRQVYKRTKGVARVYRAEGKQNN